MTDRPSHCAHCGLTFGTHEPRIVDPLDPKKQYHPYDAPYSVRERSK